MAFLWVCNVLALSERDVDLNLFLGGICLDDVKVYSTGVVVIDLDHRQDCIRVWS